MKYRELMEFEPIETVISLSDASSNMDKAAGMVESYVTSEKMTSNIDRLIISNLNLDGTGRKGIFVVGNYGSGKSHLMSVVSSIAEHKGLLEHLKDEKLREYMDRIAGRFEVLRIELGASLISLRDAVTKEIEKDLLKRGITYRFPPMDSIPNNKQCTLEMMSLFKKHYPEKGYLIVVDELLDFIRGKKENEVILDLNYLREMGELCGISDIRFITGIQEPLFDNPSFHFLADSVRRVADRFDQFIITNEDIANVVSKRLLKKNEEQRKKIREHIWRYCKLYTGMSENLERYIDLYPIHPAFFDMVGQVLTSSNREVLKAVSVIMRDRLDKDIGNGPGIISYDGYWEYILKTPSATADPGINRVMERYADLHRIISESSIDEDKKKVIYRIINALSVYRLVGGDTDSDRGVSLNGLIDGLNLFPAIHELKRDALKESVNQCITELMKATRSQFIMFNREKEEYYLDLKRDIDYDAKIDEAVDVISNDALNRYFYEILLNKLELAESSKIADAHLLWSYSLIWKEKNIERGVYIKFGLPEENSPLGDMLCALFVGPYNDIEPDQIGDNYLYFIMRNYDEKFENDLKHYSAARYLYQLATDDIKQIYDEKCRKYARGLNEWLDIHMRNAFDVRYGGKKIKIDRQNDKMSFKEIIDECINMGLYDYMATILPDYPRFNTVITNKNRNEVFRAAINFLSGKRNELGKKILESLELWDGTEVNIHDSKYAGYFLGLLNDKPDGIAREDIIDGFDLDRRFRLETEWVAVVLLSLVYCGEAVLKLQKDEINLLNISGLSRYNVSEITLFSGYRKMEKPSAEEIERIYRAVGGEGECVFDERSVKSFIDGINTLKKDINTCLSALSEDLRVFDLAVLTGEDVNKYKDELKQFNKILDYYKEYNTPIRLRNMKVYEGDEGHIYEMKAIIDRLKSLKLLKEVTRSYNGYLMEVEKWYDDEIWKSEFEAIKKDLMYRVKEPGLLNEETIDDVLRKLDDLKSRYIHAYIDIHNRCRADKNLERLRTEILNSTYKKQIDMLRSINLKLPLANYNDLINSAASIKVCQELDEGDMQGNPLCPYCKFKPVSREYVDANTLENIINELKKDYDDCASLIVDTLEDPMVLSRTQYLQEDDKKIIKSIIENKKLPDEMNLKIVNIINELLDNSEIIEVGLEDIFKDIRAKRKIFTADELKNYLIGYVDSIVGNKKVKLVIK